MTNFLQVVSFDPLLIENTTPSTTPGPPGPQGPAGPAGAGLGSWVALTNYTAGDLVVNPSGFIVSANATHTSGASYTAGNWTFVDDSRYAQLASIAPLALTGQTPSELPVANAVTASVGSLNRAARADHVHAGVSTSSAALQSTGKYFTGPGNVGTIALSLSYIYAVPLLVSAFTVDRICLEVAVAQTSGLVRLGLYLDSGSMSPGALLLDAGTIDASTTGVKELTISQALPAGWVWLAAVAQGSATGATVKSNVSSPYVVPHGSSAGLSGNSIIGVSTASGTTTGALPTPFPALVGQPSAPGTPRVYLRSA